MEGTNGPLKPADYPLKATECPGKGTHDLLNSTDELLIPTGEPSKPMEGLLESTVDSLNGQKAVLGKIM